MIANLDSVWNKEGWKPISDKVVAAAQDVATAKGLAIIIGKNEVVCGGVDITADVISKNIGK